MRDKAHHAALYVFKINKTIKLESLSQSEGKTSFMTSELDLDWFIIRQTSAALRPISLKQSDIF